MHYHFVVMEKMEEAVSKGEFLEHARVHANMYGTSAKAVEEVTVTSSCIITSSCPSCLRFILLFSPLCHLYCSYF